MPCAALSHRVQQAIFYAGFVHARVRKLTRSSDLSRSERTSSSSFPSHPPAHPRRKSSVELRRRRRRHRCHASALAPARIAVDRDVQSRIHRRCGTLQFRFFCFCSRCLPFFPTFLPFLYASRLSESAGAGSAVPSSLQFFAFKGRRDTSKLE